MRPQLLMAGAILATAALFGCDALETRYEPASLEEALKLKVASTTNRYRIPRPEIPVTARNTGVVREGSLFAFIAGPELAKSLKDFGPDVEFGVRVNTQPQLHMILETVFQGEERIDLLEKYGTFRFELPDLVSYTQVPLDRYAEVSIESVADAPDGRARAKELDVARGMMDPVLVNATESLKIGRTDRERQYLEADGMRFLVANMDASTRLMLDFLASEHKPFSGGLRVEAKFEPGVRASTGVVAAVRVKWIHLGGPLYFRPTAPGPRTPEAPAA